MCATYSCTCVYAHVYMHMCVYACEVQRLTLSSFRYCFPLCFLRLLWTWASPIDQDSRSLLSLPPRNMLPHLTFCLGAGGLNSCPHAWTENTFLTKPTSQHMYYFLTEGENLIVLLFTWKKKLSNCKADRVYVGSGIVEDVF